MRNLLGLIAVGLLACGGMEIGEAEAAPSTGVSASCPTITAANKFDARKCTVQLTGGTCSVTAGPCSACALSGSTVSVTFNQPIALTLLLQNFLKTTNVVLGTNFSKACSATPTFTVGASAADLDGTRWTLGDVNLDNPI